MLKVNLNMKKITVIKDKRIVGEQVFEAKIGSEVAEYWQVAEDGEIIVDNLPAGSLVVKLKYPHLLDEYLPLLIKNGGKELVVEDKELKFSYGLRLCDIGHSQKVEIRFEDDVRWMYDTSVRPFKKRADRVYVQAHLEVIAEDKIIDATSPFDGASCVFSEYVGLSCPKGACASVSIYKKNHLLEGVYVGPTGEQYGTVYCEGVTEIDKFVESVLDWFTVGAEEKTKLEKRIRKLVE